MFNFFKKWKKKETITVHFSEIGEWFEEQVKPIEEDMKTTLQEGVRDLGEALDHVKRSLQQLEEAPLKEADTIQQRVKTLVMGHRTNYLRLLHIFLEKTSLPEPTAPALIAFIEQLEKDLNTFTKDSSKSYYAVQHLYADNVAVVAQALQQLAKMHTNIKQHIDDSKIAVIDRVRKKLKKANDMVKQIQRLESFIVEKDKDLQQVDEDFKTQEISYSDLKNREDFTSLQKLRAERDTLEQQKVGFQSKVLDIFAPLSSIFRKYARITLDHEKLVEQYAAGPFEALLGDNQLDVLSILGHMKDQLRSGSLDIKDKKKDRALECITQIDRDTLENLLREYHFLQQRINEIEKKISENTIENELSDMQRSLAEIQAIKGVHEKERSMLTNSLESLELEKIKDELKNMISLVVHEEIIIS